jgi:hypothetical protein
VNDGVAKALEGASRNASSLEQLFVANGDDNGASQASQAQADLLFAAAAANANNALQTLGTTAGNQQALTKITANMEAKTRQLATSEANLQKFVSLAADATTLATAVAAVPPDVAGGISAVNRMLSTIGVH